MRAGMLRHRITLQALTTGRDAIGQPAQTWTDVAGLWADVRFLNGLEVVKSGIPVDVRRASIRIRYRSGVVATMRALHDGQVFDVKSVLADTTGRRYLDLVCETGENQG